MPRNVSFAALLAAASWGCHGSPPPASTDDGLNPPAPTAGQVQIASPTITGIMPGTDVTYCSYLDFNVAQDTDITGYVGYQSKGGHHAILYAAKMPQPVGTHVCTNDDMNNGSFLASTGSDTSAPSQTIPAGVAFRIKAGTQVFVQTHWINTTMETLSGEAAFNLDVGPADPTHVIAAEFVTIKLSGFTVPFGMSTLSTECSFARPLQLYMIGGHEHEHGTEVQIDKVVNGQAQSLYDKKWQPEFTFNTPFVAYSLQQPLSFAQGDIMRVTCSWNNPSPTAINFPDEMCAGFGYYFPAAAGDIYCIDGAWPPGA
jgi:hypothetical protein